jgi:glycosyltransferase involved in cell wall biosynthesis
MHIAMITSAAFPPEEGIGYFVLTLAKQLKRQGHEVQVITRGNASACHCDVLDGIKIWRQTFLPIYPVHVHLHNLFVNNLIKKIEPDVDIFHLHTPLVKFPSTTKPIVVTVHTPMKTDIRASSKKNLSGWLDRLQAPFSFSLETELFSQADQLISVSNNVAEELGEYGIKTNNIQVLGVGVDTEKFFPRETPSHLSQPYILNVGRLVYRKGVQDLIQSAAIVVKQYPNIHYLIVGDGPYRESLSKLIDKLGLSKHIKLLGHIGDREKLRTLYQDAIAYIHPAHYEGLPAVLLEAMACGCPVIATKIGGAADVIRHRENGLLVSPRDPEQVAELTISLIQDSSLRQNLGMKGHEMIINQYSWAAVSKKYADCYETLGRGIDLA